MSVVRNIKQTELERLKAASIGTYGSFDCNIIQAMISLRERGININHGAGANYQVIVVGQKSEVPSEHLAWLRSEYPDTEIILEKYFLECFPVIESDTDKLSLQAQAALMHTIANFTNAIQRHELIDVRTRPERAQKRIDWHLARLTIRNPKFTRDLYLYHINQVHRCVEFRLSIEPEFVLRVPYSTLAFV